MANKSFIGRSIDDFLRENDILEDVTKSAIKKAIAATARGWWSMTFETKAVESGEAVRTVQEFIFEFDKLAAAGVTRRALA